MASLLFYGGTEKQNKTTVKDNILLLNGMCDVFPRYVAPFYSTIN